MWYLLNKDGERCASVETREEAEKIIASSDWYVDCVYSNNCYMC